MKTIDNSLFDDLAVAEIEIGDFTLDGLKTGVRNVKLTFAMHSALNSFCFFRDSEERLFSKEFYEAIKTDDDQIEFGVKIGQLENDLTAAARDLDRRSSIDRDEVIDLCSTWRRYMRPDHELGQETIDILNKVADVLNLELRP